MPVSMSIYCAFDAWYACLFDLSRSVVAAEAGKSSSPPSMFSTTSICVSLVSLDTLAALARASPMIEGSFVMGAVLALSG